MKRDFSFSGACFKIGKTIAGECSGANDLPQECRFSWYWNRKEIENDSPSRKDGIDLRKGSQLRILYCSFLQDVGMRLAVPQVTIATAMMLCHRFYLHQSHAKNEWQLPVIDIAETMLPGSDAPDDNLPETATDVMLPNTQDFLDDVFLPPDTKTGRTVNKFAPKLRGKTRKPLTATSKPSDAPRLITSNAKQEISVTDQGNSGQDADILLGTESLDNCVRTSTATVGRFSPKGTPQLRVEKLVKADSASECTESVVLIPKLNAGSSELNIVDEPGHVMGEAVVDTEDHQDGAHVLGEPEVDKEVPKCGSHASDRNSSLHTDPPKADLEVSRDVLSEAAAGLMLPNSIDFLDDVFLPPATTIERSLNKFQPKPHGKTKKTVTATSIPSDAPQLRTFNAKQEVSMIRGNLEQGADISFGIEALDNHVQTASATVNVSIPEVDAGSSELSLVEQATHVVGGPKVYTKAHQDGAHVMGEPEISKDKAYVSDRDASVRTNPANSVTVVSTDILSETTTDARFPNSADSLDDVFPPPVATTERTVDKFQPKSRSKTKKLVITTPNQSNASESDVGFSQPNLVKEPADILGEVSVDTEVPHVWERDASRQTDPAKAMTEVSTEFDLEDGPLFHTTATIGAAGTIGASNLSSCGGAPMDCSSQVNETHEPSNVTTELLTHEASESGRSLQTDPNKSEHDAMPGMESLDDILMQPSDISEVKQVSKFRPKSGSRPKGRKAKSVSFSLPDAAETAPPPVRPLSKVLADDLEGAEPSFTQMMNKELADRTPDSTSTVFDNVDFQSDHGSLTNVDLADISGLESFDSILSEPASATGQAVPKFRPKMSTKPKTAKPVSSSNTNVAQESTSLGDSLLLDTEQLEGHNLCIPADPSTNIVNEQANPVGMSSLEVGSPGGDDEFETIDIIMVEDAGNEVPSWNDEEQTQQILDDQITSKSFQEHGADKSSRKLRKRIAVDGTPENLDCGISENCDVENSNDLPMDEYHNDDEYKGEDMPKQKEPKRSKRQLTDAQKPKRCKKASKEPDSTKTELPKKRFPHGTRRKKRQVDKVLLETPDDELDRRQLAFRDLIMLAEAKERISSKEAANLNDIHSNARSFSNGSRFDPDNPYGEDLDPDGEEAHRNMLRNSRKLNYQTYMNKPKSGRWSKSETVLFYEAIRQFGTDFEMIVQLFPNRTRSQVKSKFKTEERKHPTEVRDAMIHRSEDHSHFERVIQQLQTQAEDSMLDNANDDPAMVSGDAANANQEERDQTSKEELGEAANTEKCDEWDDDCASLDLNEYESCDWDAGTSSFQNEEKYSEYDEFS